MKMSTTKTTGAMRLGLGAMMILQSACIFAPTPGAPGPWTPVEPPVEPPVEQAELEVVYLSGHLGNYASCQEKGYSEGGVASSRPAGDVEGGFAPCEPLEDGDVDHCGDGPDLWNCQEAHLMLKLSNVSVDLDAEGVLVKQIELLDEEDMVRAILPVNQLVVVDTQQVYNGLLPSSSQVKVRVDYQGPVDLYDLLDDEEDPSFRYHSGARLRLTVGAENAEDVVIETKEVERLPEVAT